MLEHVGEDDHIEPLPAELLDPPRLLDIAHQHLLAVLAVTPDELYDFGRSGVLVREIDGQVAVLRHRAVSYTTLSCSGGKPTRSSRESVCRLPVECGLAPATRRLRTPPV